METSRYQYSSKIADYGSCFDLEIIPWWLLVIAIPQQAKCVYQQTLAYHDFFKDLTPPVSLNVPSNYMASNLGLSIKASYVHENKIQ